MKESKPSSPPCIEQPTPRRYHDIPSFILKQAIERTRSPRVGPPPPRPSPASPLDMAAIPTMSYSQATTYLVNCLQHSNLDAKQIVPVDLQICNIDGKVVRERVQHKCSLTAGSDLMTVIMMVQLEVDVAGDFIYDILNTGPDDTEIKSKLLMKSFEVRIGDAMAGMPAIAGELIGESEGGKAVRFVKWECNGSELELYWDRYRDWLLRVAGSEAPLFKILTVRCDGPPNARSSTSGHQYNRQVLPAAAVGQPFIPRFGGGSSAPLLVGQPFVPRFGAGSSARPKGVVEFPFQPGQAQASHSPQTAGTSPAGPAQTTRSTPAFPSLTTGQAQLGPSTPAHTSTPATMSASKAAEGRRVRTRYNKAAMEEMLRDRLMFPKITHQTAIESCEQLLAALIIKYIVDNDGEQPSVEEMHAMRVEIRDNGFGSGPELKMMASEKKDAEKQKGWVHYQQMGGSELTRGMAKLEEAKSQPTLTARFVSAEDPTYEDPIDQASKGQAEEKNAANMLSRNVNAMTFREHMEKAAEQGDLIARRVLAMPGIKAKEREAAIGLEDSDDKLYLKDDVTGEENTDAEDKKSAPQTDMRASIQPEMNNENSIQRYGQPSTSFHPLHADSQNTPSPYHGYNAGGNQNFSNTHAGNRVFPTVHQTPKPSQGGGFPQFGHSYTSPGHITPFNPTAAPWSSGGTNTVDFANNMGYTGSSGGVRLFGTPTNTSAGFNPIVPNFQSRIPSSQPNPFVSGNNRSAITSLTGNPNSNPFAHKYPVRYEGAPGTIPFNPNRPNFGNRPKQSTPLKESTTTSEAEGPDSDMQYGTSMRLHLVGNPRPNLSAILHGESSSSGPAMGGFNVAVGQGVLGGGSASGPTPSFITGTAQIGSRKDRGQNRPKYNRGGSSQGGRGSGHTQ